MLMPDITLRGLSFDQFTGILIRDFNANSGIGDVGFSGDQKRRKGILIL